MTTLVAQMTKDELVELIETTIEQKLIEILHNLDDEVDLKQAVRERLLHQRQQLLNGERGQSFEEVVQIVN